MPEWLEDEDDEDHVPLVQLHSMRETKARARASSMMDGSLSDVSRPASPMASVDAGSHAWDADIFFSSAEEGEEEGCVLILLPYHLCHCFELPTGRLTFVLFSLQGGRGQPPAGKAFP